MYESAIGTTTARPPWAPVELGLLAGRELTPGAAHVDPLAARGGGRDDPVGGPVEAARTRTASRPEDEVRAVHESLGVIDVSTLGKLLVEGPEAVALLERLYPNRFGDMKTGPDPLRRPHLGRRPDHGRRHDRAARRRPLLRDDDLDRRRRGDRVVRVVERGLGLRGGDRQRHGRARGGEPRRAAVARRARSASSRTRTTSPPRSSGTSTRRSSRSPASRRSRCGSASSASSGTSSTSRARRASTSGTGSSPRARGRSASSRSACSGSRRGTSSSARTRTRSRTSTRRACPGCRSWTRTTSSASSRSSTSRSARRRSGSSASRWRTTSSRPRARRSSIEGLPAGRVTSARRSEAVGAVIGLAWVPADRSEPRDARRDPGRPAAARRAGHARRVLRSRRGADARVSCAFLSPSRCAPGTIDVAAPACARRRRSRAVVRDLSLEGIVEIRGDVDARRRGRRRGARAALASARLPLHRRRSRRRR